MGVAVSSWRLARAVSLRGQLGVVSGTGIDTVVARRLQMGDPGGHLRAAFDAFPVPAIARRVWERHYIEGGKTTRRGLQVEGGADDQDAEGTARPDRVEQLRRGVSREGRAHRTGRHQPAREGATAESRHPVRRDAGGRRLRADGCRHSPVDTGRARSLRGGRACRVDAGCGGCIAWREVRQPLRSTELSSATPSVHCSGRNSWPSSRRRRWRSRSRARAMDGSTASSSKARARVVTTLRPAARKFSTTKASRSTDRAMRRTWSRFEHWDCRSGWPDRTAMRPDCSRHWSWVRAASRSAPHSHSATNPAWPRS